MTRACTYTIATKPILLIKEYVKRPTYRRAPVAAMTINIKQFHKHNYLVLDHGIKFNRLKRVDLYTYSLMNLRYGKGVGSNNFGSGMQHLYIHMYTHMHTPTHVHICASTHMI